MERMAFSESEHYLCNFFFFLKTESPESTNMGM